MSKDAARRIIDVAVRHLDEQGAVLAEVRDLCSAEEFKMYKRMIEDAILAIGFDVINPIVARYPDLKPPQMDEP